MIDFSTQGETFPKPSRKEARWRVVLSRVKRKILRHLWLVRIGLLLPFALVLVLLFWLTRSFWESTMTIPRAMLSFLTPANVLLTTEARTNILILGVGGANHEAPELTDTIIFSSYSHKSGSLLLFSLPRDIWVPDLRAKLNSAYYWGNRKTPGGGEILAKSAVAKIVGEGVHYTVVVDFGSFVKLIDFLGGIEVGVENSFVDRKYPIPGAENDECQGDPLFACRYETLTFEKGKQVFDGERALKFARSRNAEGDEGTDFARARRQQKIIEAVRDKITTFGFLLNPGKVKGLLEIARESFKTDLPPSLYPAFLRVILKSRGDKIRSVVLDGWMKNGLGPEGPTYLHHPPVSSSYDNQWVLVPAREDQGWTDVHLYVECLVTTEENTQDKCSKI